ncbi:unnamed protein product, partial [Mesorhabditis belari]|uniref:Drebrin-like protein n=1 Tax=Mesorhabditis belari TaxID=2138241 RepID=A0AAF3E959_9BILA
MTLNYSKNGVELQKAYEEVVGASNPNEKWVIFDYEGTANVLRLGDQGDEGLDEFAASFNAGRVQFGIAKVQFDQTALPKILLVHWQGEGVPSSRLATTTSHVRDVERFLKTVHCVLHARSELDVDEREIRKALSKLPSFSSSNVETSYANPEPVNSVYRPVKPSKDINAKEREDFWKAMEIEENQRKREEIERQQHEREKQKKEQERETKESEIKREKMAQERVAARPPVQDNNQMHKPSSIPSKFNLCDTRKQLFESQIDQSLPVPKTPSKPMPKSQPSPVISPFKAPSFEKNQESDEDNYYSPPAPALPKFEAPKISAAILPPSAPPPSIPKVESPKILESNTPTMYDTVPGELPEPTSKTPPEQHYHHEEPPTFHQSNTPTMYDTVPGELPELTSKTPTKQHYHHEEPPAFHQAAPSLYDTVPGEQQGMRARALWDYQAEDETELSFDPDDEITDIEQVDAGWWRGRAKNGKIGLFPSNYVQIIN